MLLTGGGDAFRPEIQTDDLTSVRAEHDGVRSRAAADIERPSKAGRNGAAEQRIEQPATRDEPEVAPLDLGEPAETRRRKRRVWVRNGCESSGRANSLSTALRILDRPAR